VKRYPHHTRARRLTTVVAIIGLALVAACSSSKPSAAPSTQPKATSKALDTTPIVPSAKPTSGWQLIWNDEFNGTGKVNPTNWLYDTGHHYNYPGAADNWGTQEVEAMTDSTTNVRQDGQGHLLISPVKGASGNWTSGRIETQRTDFRPPPHGVLRVEASIQLPAVSGQAGLGYWPSFWMVGAPARAVGSTNWPSIGEADIFENINGLGSVYETLHCGVLSKGPCKETGGLSSGPKSFNDLQSKFHTFAFEWDERSSPSVMRWYVDGHLYHTVSQTQPGMTAQAWQQATDHGYFIILCVAMGGAFPNAVAHATTPTASTVSGAPMMINYVRVSALAAS
jgi:beta-glucanase (GH16 family)